MHPRPYTQRHGPHAMQLPLHLKHGQVKAAREHVEDACRAPCLARCRLQPHPNMLLVRLLLLLLARAGVAAFKGLEDALVHQANSWLLLLRLLRRRGRR